MEIRIKERVNDTVTRIEELTAEILEYQQIAMCLDALREVHANPEKYQCSPDDETKVIQKLTKLCQKHEIVLPEYVEWASVEIL